LERRRAQWRASTRNADLRITFAEGGGFACLGPQRDPTLLDLGYPEELYAIYVQRKAQGKGLGSALLRPLISKPLTILVLAGNAGAVRFYRHFGAELLMERPEKIGDTSIVELVFGISQPVADDSRLAPRPPLR
jgi:GNAT superfamily N-acetyltransferase